MPTKYETYDPVPPSGAPTENAAPKYQTYDISPTELSPEDKYIQSLYAPAHRNAVADSLLKAKNAKVVENAQIIDTLKGRGTFDDTSTFEDVNGKTSLFDVGRSDENTEKYRKFKASWPKGDMMFIPTDNGIIPVARTSPQEPYRKLGNWGPTLAGIASPQTAISVAAAIGTGGASLPISIAAQAGAGVIGSIVDNQIEAARGYQDSSVVDQAGDAVFSGVLGGGLEAPSRWVTGAMGKTKAAILNSFRDLALAGKEIPILKGQVGNPIKTTVFKLVSKASPIAKYRLREQRNTIKGLIEQDANFTPEQLAAMSDQELANYLEVYGTDIILSKFGSLNAAEKNATGKMLMTALERFKKVSTAANDSLYEKALAQGENEVWDPRPLQKYAREKLVPVTGRADAGGKMGEGVYGDVELSAPLNKELSSIYEAIVALDPNGIAMHKGNSGIKQLMTLRTRVGDLLQQELPSEQERSVRQLYGMLTDTIENPATGNAAFVQSWGEANAAYRETQNFLQFGQVKAALTQGKAPEKVVDKVFQPGNLDFIQYLRKNLTADPDTAPAWQMMQDRFRTQFFKNNDTLAGAQKVLAKYDKAELDTLMPAADQRLLNLASTQAQQIKSGPVSTMLKQFDTDGARILKFVEEGNEAEINRLVKAAGGPNSDAAGALRAGVFQNLLHAASYVDTDTGQALVDPKKLSAAIGELRKSKRLNSLFTPEDWQRFGNWEKAGAVIGKGVDDGTSIQMGELASELTQTPFHMVTNPKKLGYLVLHLGFMDTLGYVLSKPETFEKVLAAGENMDRKRRDRALINVTGQALGNVYRAWEDAADMYPMSENERKTQVLQQDPGLWEYLKEKFGGSFDPGKTPSNAPPPPQPPDAYPAVPERQGSLQPAPRTGIMTTNMAQTMPPRPAPAMAQPSPAQGSKYAALFPNDSLGTLAASGGIASLTG